MTENITDIIFRSDHGATVGVVQLDAGISENHKVSATATKHAIEDGADVTDHIQPNPDTVSITGVITQTPVRYLASVQSRSPLLGDTRTVNDRVKSGFDELKRIIKDRELVDVATSLEEYTNMALLDMDILREASKGQILYVTLYLEEILKGTAQTIDVIQTAEPVQTSKKKTSDKGKKVGETPSDKQESSALYNIGKWLGI